MLQDRQGQTAFVWLGGTEEFQLLKSSFERNLKGQQLEFSTTDSAQVLLESGSCQELLKTVGDQDEPSQGQYFRPTDQKEKIQE